MTKQPPITRVIGTAERHLQALLARELNAAGLSFGEWTVLTFLSAGPLAAGEVKRRLAAGQIAVGAAGAKLLERMTERQLIEPNDGVLSATAAGQQCVSPVRDRVGQIVGTLLDGVDADDLAATTRTLNLLAERAGAALAA